VKLTYVTPEIELSYISPDGAPGDDAGDPYTGWDRFGRTQDLRWTKGEELLDQTRYGYNRSSQRTWRTAPLATSGHEDEAYQYDGLYQITGRQRGDLNTNHTAIGGIPVRAEAFNYDPIGNWQQYQVSADGTLVLDQTRVHDKANTLTQINSSSALLDHDPSGNMTLCPPPADGEWDEALTLVWDAWNRLTEVRTEDGTTLIAKYAYDGLWRRTTRQIGPGPVIHTYYNAQWRPLQETEDNGSTTVLARSYDWGMRYRDDLIRRINHLEDEATHYALHDYYNVTAIVGCAAGSCSSGSSPDSSVAVLERYGYSAFGDVRFMTAAYTSKSASDHAWDLLYKAQFLDIETGFYNYGYRYLSPMLGRWLSRDPIGEEGGVNLYGFVENNGLNGTDLLGLAEAIAAGGAIAESAVGRVALGAVAGWATFAALAAGNIYLAVELRRTNEEVDNIFSELDKSNELANQMAQELFKVRQAEKIKERQRQARQNGTIEI
jgi:RHS repeat-associated protein